MSEDTTKSLHPTHKPDSKPQSQSSDNDPSAPIELTAMVENLLNDLQDKFAEHSKKILGKLNDMSARIDELEKSLEKVIQQDENEQPQQ